MMPCSLPMPVDDLRIQGHLHTYIYIYTIYKKSNMSVRLSLLCSLCMATVLSGTAPNLARAILIPYRWSWGGELESATRAPGLTVKHNGSSTIAAREQH